MLCPWNGLANSDPPYGNRGYVTIALDEETTRWVLPDAAKPSTTVVRCRETTWQKRQPISEPDLHIPAARRRR